MESLENLTFDHSCDMVFESFGLAEAECESIRDRLAEINGDVGTISATLEQAISEFKGKHLLFAIMDVGRSLGMSRGSPVDDLLRMMRG